MRRIALTDHAAREKIRDRGENIRRLKVMQDPGKVERRDSLDTGDNEKYYRKHSGKHDSAYALEYYRRHRESTMRRLSNWREQQMAAAALSLTGARKIIDMQKKSINLAVDGGINLDNISKVIKAGAEIIVAGQIISKSANPEETIKKIKNILN